MLLLHHLREVHERNDEGYRRADNTGLSYFGEFGGFTLPLSPRQPRGGELSGGLGIVLEVSFTPMEQHYWYYKHTKFPTLAVCVAFEEDWESAMADVRLLLNSTNRRTKGVLWFLLIEECIEGQHTSPLTREEVPRLGKKCFVFFY